MPNSYTPVYHHYVWSTLCRRPMISPEWEHRLHAALVAKCRSLGCLMVEVNGMSDHVHVLVRMPVTATIQLMAHDMKGSSSHLINHLIAPGIGFRWQNTYSARGVDPDRVSQVRAYIRNQKSHHARDTLVSEWERYEE